MTNTQERREASLWLATHAHGCTDNALLGSKSGDGQVLPTRKEVAPWMAGGVEKEKGTQ